MLLYYITDRQQFPGNENHHRAHLLQAISAAARAGVDYIQLREKDLPTRELESLSQEAVRLVRKDGGRTRLLVNSRTDVAIAAGADGVHLRSQDISPADARSPWRISNAEKKLVVAVSCHTESEVIEAEKAGADFVVFGPVFEKGGSDLAGIAGLRKACQHKIPVLALGGVTLDNARDCLDAGAAGIAGIRVFQEGDMVKTVAQLSSIVLDRGSDKS